MGDKDADQFSELDDLQMGFEGDLFRDLSLQRLRAKEGLPILNSQQLASMNSSLEEMLLYRSEYDRFSPRLKTGGDATKRAAS